MKTQRSTNGTKVAIGYVRVSTQEQASEGVSLDAQRDRLRAYCKLNSIKLIDIKADEGISGGTLERPGLQAALAMLRRGTANTLIVVKLDRLSRSIRDVCSLVEDYFSDERFHLLSLCGMANTHTAAGRMGRVGPRTSTARLPEFASGGTPLTPPGWLSAAERQKPILAYEPRRADVISLSPSMVPLVRG